MYFLLNKNLVKSPVSLFHLLNMKFNVSGFILWAMFEPSSQSVGFVLRSETFWILFSYLLPSLFYLATGILKTFCGQCCSWLSLLTCIQFDVLRHYILRLSSLSQTSWSPFNLKKGIRWWTSFYSWLFCFTVVCRNLSYAHPRTTCQSALSLKELK